MNKMKDPNIKKLDVYIHDQKVGTLAQMKNGLTAFQYDPVWLAEGFSISPFSLPLDNRVFVPKRYETFDGLFGVFADSLPDGWGRLVTDRWLRRQGLDPDRITSLTRLALIGSAGKGALSYRPVIEMDDQIHAMALDDLAREAVKLFDDDKSEHLDELLQYAGSSGGARPKANIEMNQEKWIVKFPSRTLREEDGVMEYDYSQCARACGLDIPETRLLPSEQCAGYFAVKRFDQQPGWKKHMLSLSALLETSHRIPNLDYEIIFKAAAHLTRDSRELEKLYRLTCFNVFAHNRDDHSRNFAFLYDENRKAWQLSPAYDLTYSNSFGGEHATTVMGNGKNPGRKELLELAKKAGLKKRAAESIVNEIENTVKEMLSGYLK